MSLGKLGAKVAQKAAKKILTGLVKKAAKDLTSSESASESSRREPHTSLRKPETFQYFEKQRRGQ